MTRGGGGRGLTQIAAAWRTQIVTAHNSLTSSRFWAVGTRVLHENPMKWVFFFAQGAPVRYPGQCVRSDTFGIQKKHRSPVLSTSLAFLLVFLSSGSDIVVGCCGCILRVSSVVPINIFVSHVCRLGKTIPTSAIPARRNNRVLGRAKRDEGCANTSEMRV